MRTTLTLDRDVAERVQQEVHRKRKSLKAVVNEALRAGLGMGERTGRRPRARFQVKPHAFGFRPGIDLDRINQLLDELEATETAGKLAR
jgi:hypothetical protein